jgi:hypothetical protein
VKEDQKSRADGANVKTSGGQSAHLSFRRIAIHEFSTETEPQQIRFYYRSHRKHAPAARAA